MTPQLLAAFLLLGCAQPPPRNDQSAAPPAAALPAGDEAERAALMDRIEREVRLPEGARPLTAYGRFYAWQQREDGIRKVVAIYIVGEAPGRRWVTENEMPAVLDGGCGIVSLSFDVAAGRIEGVACNGEA